MSGLSLSSRVVYLVAFGPALAAGIASALGGSGPWPLVIGVAGAGAALLLVRASRKGRTEADALVALEREFELPARAGGEVERWAGVAAHTRALRSGASSLRTIFDATD